MKFITTRPVSTEYFDQVLENRIEATKAVLGSKAKEYADDTDRLHNFNTASRKLSAGNRAVTREQALVGMMIKHEISIGDIIDKTAAGVPVSADMISEKIGGMINYLILLECSLYASQNDIAKEVREADID